MTRDADSPAAPPPRPWIGWRLAAMVYDLWPVLALWLLLSAAFTLGFTFVGHHDPHENIAPLSGLQVALWIGCWLLTGLYAVISWHTGGQTLGMRPWRLRVRTRDGGRPTRGALWLRFVVATMSLLAGGLGFWWAWIDRDRLTWHDRASGTRVMREARRVRTDA